MNWDQDMAGESPELKQALKHFKASVDAWSYAVSTDAAYSRPRTAAKVAMRHSWRMAAGWALGCLLAAGSLAGAGHEIYRRQELARVAAQKAAQQAAQQRAAAGRAIALRASAQVEKTAPAVAIAKVNAGTQDEDLLASVDSDVSREVPAAMEPLAQLMDDNGTQ
jgi:hypothetical protein